MTGVTLPDGLCISCTGKQTYKRVTDTLITHPSRLCHVTYRSKAIRGANLRLSSAARLRNVPAGSPRMAQARSSLPCKSSDRSCDDGSEGVQTVAQTYGNEKTK